MELLLLRHGAAGSASSAGSDELRELTPEGLITSRAMATMLKGAGLVPAAIVASPLVRAQQTGEVCRDIFEVPLRLDHRLRPGTELGSLQQIVDEANAESLLVVGHEPDISRVVHRLTGGSVKMQKCGLARILLQRVEPGSGIILSLLAPDVLPQHHT